MDSWHYDGDCVPSDLLGNLGDDAMNVTYEVRTSRNAIAKIDAAIKEAGR